jgi:molybdenum cofactor cytidylyltransferase
VTVTVPSTAAEQGPEARPTGDTPVIPREAMASTTPSTPRGARPLGVILAAGAGSRWAAAGGPGHKLLALHRGHTVVWWAATHALDAGLNVVVVAGAVDLAGVVPEGVTILLNPRWAEGQSTSLLIGTAEATRIGAPGVIVGLGDQPRVPTSSWMAIAEATVEATRPIIVASYEGVRGQPIALMAEVFPLLPVEGDEGARTLIRVSPHRVLEVPCAGSPRQLADIDSPKDLDSWN